MYSWFFSAATIAHLTTILRIRTVNDFFSHSQKAENTLNRLRSMGCPPICLGLLTNLSSVSSPIEIYRLSIIRSRGPPLPPPPPPLPPSSSSSSSSLNYMYMLLYTLLVTFSVTVTVTRKYISPTKGAILARPGFQSEE